MRLELKDARSSKFWEIQVDDRKVTTRWGRIGAEGQTKEERLATPTAARARYEGQLAEKLKKGYQLAPGQVPVTPRGNADPRLEQAVREHPEDERAYLVLADALSELGDPRGELISVQHAIGAAKGAAATKLKAREKKLLSAFGLPAEDLVTFRWRWGFLQAAHFHNAKDWMDADFDAVALARQVFAMPMCAVLEELELGVLRWEYQEDDAPAVLKEAAKQPWAPRLRRLKIGHFPDDDIDLAHHPVGDLKIVPKAFGALEELFIHSGAFELPPLALPKLKALTIESCGLSSERLRAVTKGRLPALERLRLWFGSADYGADSTADDVAPILDGAAFPKLRHLGLMNAEFTDALCERLTKAKVLPQLKTLDLSMGTMTAAGAQALAKHARAFAHLDVLVVDDNFLDAAGLEALNALGCEVDAGEQKEEDTSMGKDQVYRYVTVRE